MTLGQVIQTPDPKQVLKRLGEVRDQLTRRYWHDLNGPGTSELTRTLELVCDAQEIIGMSEARLERLRGELATARENYARACKSRDEVAAQRDAYEKSLEARSREKIRTQAEAARRDFLDSDLFLIERTKERDEARAELAATRDQLTRAVVERDLARQARAPYRALTGAQRWDNHGSAQCDPIRDLAEAVCCGVRVAYVPSRAFLALWSNAQVRVKCVVAGTAEQRIAHAAGLVALHVVEHSDDPATVRFDNGWSITNVVS